MKIIHNANSAFINKVLFSQPHLFIYMLFLVAFTLEEQSWVWEKPTLTELSKHMIAQINVCSSKVGGFYYLLSGLTQYLSSWPLTPSKIKVVSKTWPPVDGAFQDSVLKSSCTL